MKRYRLDVLARTLAVVFALSVCLPAQEPPALTFTDLRDINANGGDLYGFNSGMLAQARDGNLYLETRGGGTSLQGGVASFSTLGAEKTIYSFNGSSAGSLPQNI